MSDISIYRERRQKLLAEVARAHPDKDGGAIVLFADFEGERAPFRQESSFLYLSGITEPGAVLVIDRRGKTTLFIPNCGAVRQKWVKAPVTLSPEMVEKLAVDEVAVLGSECAGYQLHPFFGAASYEQLSDLLKGHVAARNPLFTLYPASEYGYTHQRLTLLRLEQFVPGLINRVVDVAPLVADMRRTKTRDEIEYLYNAVEVTLLAQQAAAQAIDAGVPECEVQAHVEFIMTCSCLRPAFPSIVASGQNSTILHYTADDTVMHDGDLVVVDIGAECHGYAADITRTYPVSGTFTDRQREVYDLVLETQQYIAGIAKPGYWLSNAQEPERSLNHLAKQFLTDKGYGDYFPHGIGHYLGLDVHDVGDYGTPLRPGDVFTIEPGIYIPHEQIGVRIEDDYWVVEDGVVCLSEGLPSTSQEIELLAQRTLEETS